jgi:hypothetical protein
LTITLPIEDGGPDVDALYEDIGELDAGSLAGLKALYSDARKRAAVAAGIGAYLYTTLEQVVLPIGPDPRQVQAIRRPGKSDLLVLHNATEQWLRDGYRNRMSTDAVRRDLGEILSHGEPETGIGQGEAAETAEEPVAANGAPDETGAAAGAIGSQDARDAGEVVAVEFGGPGPAARPTPRKNTTNDGSCAGAGDSTDPPGARPWRKRRGGSWVRRCSSLEPIGTGDSPRIRVP